MSKRRLDQILSDLYPQWTRSKLQTLIEKGNVEVFHGGWKVETRPGAKFDDETIGVEQLRVRDDEEFQYVSRGALKLKGAIEEFEIELKGKTALDVGLSTGGFSDYLLQNGIERVLGVDVGSQQLHNQLHNHPGLTAFDKVNAKEALPETILKCFFKEDPPQFDLIVVDVSFISLTKIIPNLIKHLSPQSDLVTLLKPQFELSREDLNKKGVVKSAVRVEEAKKKVIEVLQQYKLEIMNIIQSPIEGENGNKEFLIWSRPR